jgi:hypothetical protein
MPQHQHYHHMHQQGHTANSFPAMPGQALPPGQLPLPAAYGVTPGFGGPAVHPAIAAQQQQHRIAHMLALQQQQRMVDAQAPQRGQARASATATPIPGQNYPHGRPVPSPQPFDFSQNPPVPIPAANAGNPPPAAAAGAPQALVNVQSWSFSFTQPPTGGPLDSIQVQNMLGLADMQQPVNGAPPRGAGQPASTGNASGSVAPDSIPAPGTSDAAAIPAAGHGVDDSSAAATGSDGISANLPQPALQGQPEVYILSSPSGPRGLLINQASAEMYYTPIAGTPNIRPPGPFGPGFFVPPMPTAGNGLSQPVMQFRHRFQGRVPNGPVPDAPAPGEPRHVANQDGENPVLAPDAAAAGAPRAPAHPANPPAAGAIAAIWPHIWLLIRLSMFVWWFTSGDSSWYRWITIFSLALAILIINTGLLNGVAEQIWNPLRQHLEGLLPLGDGNGNRNAAQNPPAPPAQAAEQNGAGGAAQRAVDTVPAAAAVAPATAEPDPADTAARLLAQRRDANGNWLMAQVRRVERASLLFLASIAPGVAERHIAHLEEEARAAERRQREAEEEAARQAAAAAEASAATAASEDGAEAGPREIGEASNAETAVAGDEAVAAVEYGN